MRAALKSSLVALLALGLAACASTPPDTYEISPPPLGEPRDGPSRRQLLIPEPTAVETIDSKRIIIKPSPNSIQFLGESQWSDRLPRLVQLRLLQAFENTAAIGAVGVPGQGLAIDYQLLMEIRRFEVDVTGAATAEVQISVKVLNDRNGSVIRTRIFNAQAPVVGTGNPAFVAALDAAFERISAEIVAWTAQVV
ncbi:ABC-type transport auxiliary lipoprotein family protein [Aurantimonas sp. A2-1-M11]|uniref:ABC-type transport auxiliary lipoprotein family protein n=1 Tax=Aurantimonas sp. A2-1-M11 TaxID=3113712 RepID=UPI002F92A8BE